MLNLLDIEYSQEAGAFVAIFDDGDTVVLDADTYNEAREQAVQIMEETNEEMEWE